MSTSFSPPGVELDTLMELSGALRATLLPLYRSMRAVDNKLTPTQWSVLGTIHRAAPITLSNLAAKENLSPATISRAVVSLEEAGLVDRLTDPTDRRICRVKLSDVGYQWINDGRAVRDAWLTERLSNFNSSEIDRLAAAVPILERLSQQGG